MSEKLFAHLPTALDMVCVHGQKILLHCKDLCTFRAALVEAFKWELKWTAAAPDSPVGLEAKMIFIFSLLSYHMNKFWWLIWWFLESDPCRSLTLLRLGLLHVCTDIYKGLGGFPKHPYIPPSFWHILCPPRIKAPSRPWGLTIPVQWLLFHMLTWGHKARGISRQQPVSDAQQYSSFILCQEYFLLGEPKVAGLAT